MKAALARRRTSLVKLQKISTPHFNSLGEATPISTSTSPLRQDRRRRRGSFLVFAPLLSSGSRLASNYYLVGSLIGDFIFAAYNCNSLSCPPSQIACFSCVWNDCRINLIHDCLEMFEIDCLSHGFDQIIVEFHMGLMRK